MIYLDGDNDIEHDAIVDFLEISSVATASNLNTVIEFDRYAGSGGSGDDTSYGNWSDTKIFVVTNGMTPTPENATVDLGEQDMGASQTLADFVEWSIANYPATHYMLDLWDHGGDWYGLCWDATNGSVLRLGFLSTALYAVQVDYPAMVYDIISFDACAMGSIEVADEMAGFADYMLASEIYVPDDGFNYSSLQAIVDTPDITPLDLCDRFMTDYSAYYYSLLGTPNEDELNGSFTLSTTDLNALPSLVSSIDTLAGEMIASNDAWWDQIYMARNLTEDYPGWTYNDIVDIYTMCEQLSLQLASNATAQSLLSDVMDAFNSSVVGSVKGTNPAHSVIVIDHANGLSIYYPGNNSYFDTEYSVVGNRFQSDTLWDEFLDWAMIGRPFTVAYEPSGDSVPTDAAITVWLSEPLNTYAPYTVHVYPTGEYGSFVSGYLSYNETDNTVVFVPSANLLPGTNYTVEVDWYDWQWNHGGGYWQFTTTGLIPEFQSLVAPVLSLLAIAFVISRRAARARRRKSE
jgi:hypothetical protein